MIDAFDAARYCIDTLKETAPIWKQEHWARRLRLGARTSTRSGPSPTRVDDDRPATREA